MLMKTGFMRTSIDIPRDLHRRLRQAAARQGCSARQLILASIEQSVKQAESRTARPQRRLKLDPPLIAPRGRHLNLTNEQIYELIEFP
jgi:predicted transcriptional regulator